MRPPATATSALRGPPGANTVPPLRTRSGGKVGPPEEGPEGDASLAEGLGGALFPIEDADHCDHLAAGRADLLDRVQGRSSGGQDVLDDGDPVPRLQQTLQRPGRAVLLGLLAHQYARQGEAP